MSTQAVALNLKAETHPLGELMFEIDSLYVSTEMVLSPRFKEFPLDGLLLEACLMHFRVVSDFFYTPRKKNTDMVASDYVPGWQPNPRSQRLAEIHKWLHVMVAHLTTHRTDPKYKIGEVMREDIQAMRTHLEGLWDKFLTSLPADKRTALKNPLVHKFTAYKLLPRG